MQRGKGLDKGMNARDYWGPSWKLATASVIIDYMSCVMLNSKYVYSSSLTGQSEGNVGKGVKIFP